MTDYERKEAKLRALLARAGVRHFQAWELLKLGGQHSSPGTKGYGKNTYPPDNLLPNIIPATVALDLARRELGSPVETTCIYRNKVYNAAVGGEEGSFHMSFHAIDFYPSDRTKLAEITRILERLREAGVWMGGLGKNYKTFRHIDCGTRRNRTW